jgi:hypothetical protein
MLSSGDSWADRGVLPKKMLRPSTNARAMKKRPVFSFSPPKYKLISTKIKRKRRS